MRPVEFAPEAIIQAGKDLQTVNRNVTGFALRQKVGGGSPSRLKQVWDEHLDSQSMTKVEPVAERDLQRILNKIEYEEARRMGTNGGLARNLTEYDATTGNWRYMIEYRRKVASITPADIQRVAQQYFTRENRTVGFITKKGGGQK